VIYILVGISAVALLPTLFRWLTTSDSETVRA
jgi:uncharacterized membrane protein YuzA (DUF378 family)